MNILVLFLNNELRTGGHRRLLELCEDMAAKGHEAAVILNNDLAYEPRHFIPMRVHCPYVRGKGGSLSSRFKRAVQKIPGEQLPKRPDLILIFGETHLKAGLYLKKKLNTQLAYGQRSVPVQENRIKLHESGLSITERLRALIEIAVYRLYEKKISSHCCCIIFQSSSDQEDYISRNPKAQSRTYVIPGNIGEPHYKPEYAGKNRSTSCRKLLFIGNLGARKGIRYLVKALEILRDEGINDFHLDIIGPQEWEEWMEEQQKKGIGTYMTIHGKVKNPFEYIIHSDLLIVPSTFDSFPNSVLEALHCGTAVIGSEAGGIPYILKSRELLFPVQNAESIAEILKSCIMSPEYYMKLKGICMSRVHEFHFDWGERWITAFTDALSSIDAS